MLYPLQKGQALPLWPTIFTHALPFPGDALPHTVHTWLPQQRGLSWSPTLKQLLLLLPPLPHSLTKVIFYSSAYLLQFVIICWSVINEFETL